MTKSEMIKVLIAKGFDEYELKKLNAAGLEKKLAELEAAPPTHTEPANAANIDDTEKQVEITAEREIVLEHTQLVASKNFIKRVKNNENASISLFFTLNSEFLEAIS